MKLDALLHLRDANSFHRSATVFRTEHKNMQNRLVLFMKHTYDGDELSFSS